MFLNQYRGSFTQYGICNSLKNYISEIESLWAKTMGDIFYAFARLFRQKVSWIKLPCDTHYDMATEICVLFGVEKKISLLFW